MVSEVAVSDSGPIIHLSEIRQTKCFTLFKRIIISSQIYDEIKKSELAGFYEIDQKLFQTEHLSKKEIKNAELLAKKYKLSFTDATVIQLARQNDVNIILTDDLEVRDVGKVEGLTPVGSIGVLLRAYREHIISREELITSLDNLLGASTLYITSDLIQKVKQAIEEYRK